MCTFAMSKAQKKVFITNFNTVKGSKRIIIY